MPTIKTVAGYPDASTTGVPDGVILKASGAIVVTKAGTVLSGLDIKGDIYVDAPNVTIENCRITSSSWQGINTSGDADGLVVKNCEINGGGKVAGSYGIMGTGTFIGNDIYGFENGIGVSGSNAVIKNNYIHDLQAPGAAHYDGIAIQGGNSNILVQGNTVLARDTSDIFIKNDFGPISNVTVTQNYLGGDAGYNIYVDGRAGGGSITGVKITDNYIDKGFYGFYSIDNSSPTLTGNVTFDSDTGSIPKPPVVVVQPPTNPPPTNPPPTDPPPTDPTDPTPPTNPPPSNPTKIVEDTNDSNWVTGTAASEKIIGHDGNDALFGGGGNDVFVYLSIDDSLPGIGQRDLIHDFKPGDKIDLSAIDAVTGWRGSGNQSFTFGDEGTLSDSSPAGTLKYHFESTANGDRTVIEGTTSTGEGVQFQIALIGRIDLSASDFIL